LDWGVKKPGKKGSGNPMITHPDHAIAQYFINSLKSSKIPKEKKKKEKRKKRSSKARTHSTK